jgi:4-amino-4-deoxy-L-arabinose transferase-like glycosyltransferase
VSAGRRAWLYGGLLMALAVAVRALMLPHPTLDADMAMTGLMARHILNGEFPIFFWGQPYCGAIEAYLAAPVFAIFGSSRVTLCASVALISLGFVWLAYAAANDMWGRRAGLLAMLLAALPPSYFLVHNILPRAAYIEIPTLSLLLGWLAWRLARNKGTSWEYLVYGIAAGLGFWTHFLIAYALLGSALYLLLSDWRVLIRKSLPLMIIGFLLGSLPLWIYNLEEPFATFLYLTRPKFHVSALEAFWRDFVDGISGVLAAWAGGRGAPVQLSPFYYGAGALGLASLGWLVQERRQSLWRLVRFDASQTDGSELWLLILLAALIVTVLTGESASYTLRHLVPVYAALIPLGAYLLDRLWQRGFKAISWSFLALILAMNLAGLYEAANIFHPERYQPNQALERLNKALAKNMLAKGVRHAYTYEYWDAYIFNFDVAEEVILDTPSSSHYPLYMRDILADPQAGFTVRFDKVPYENPLRAAGARFKVFKQSGQGGPFYCLHDVQGPQHGLVEVSKEKWNLTTRPHPASASLILDNAVSSWCFYENHKAIAVLDLDLGRVEDDLCLLRLVTGNSGGSAAHLTLETSLDGRSWSQALKLNGYRWPIFHAGQRFIINVLAPIQDLYFAPRSARFLRLIINNHPKSDEAWHLSELSLYRAAPTSAPLEPHLVTEAARGLGIKAIYAEQNLMARLPQDLTAHHSFCPGPALWPDQVAEQIMLPQDLAGIALVMEPYQAPALMAFLKGQGVSWQMKKAGGYHLFYGLKRSPLPRGVRPRVARARSSSGDEAKAWDGDPTSRWATGRPRKAGDFLELTLAKPMRIRGLVLDSIASPHDLPDGLILELSPDGVSWRQIKVSQLSTGPLVFAGDRLLASFNLGYKFFIFPEQEVAALRLISPEGNPVYYFSVHELRVVPAEKPH